MVIQVPSLTRARAQKGPMLGLMLCCRHLEILISFGTRVFSFCTGPTNYGAGPKWRPLQETRSPFCPRSPAGEGLSILVTFPGTSPLVQPLQLCIERPSGGKAEPA